MVSVSVKLVPAGPLIALPPKYHWYARGAVPVAATVKVAVPPTGTVWFAGWLVTATGGTTVRVATLLVTLPYAFVTTSV